MQVQLTIVVLILVLIIAGVTGLVLFNKKEKYTSTETQCIDKMMNMEGKALSDAVTACTGQDPYHLDMVENMRALNFPYN
jgi:hypothetical protein